VPGENRVIIAISSTQEILPDTYACVLAIIAAAKSAVRSVLWELFLISH
jgi:hypothetical protein